MYKIICVSNRRLCTDLADFTERIHEISTLGIPVILREKDLTEIDYTNLLKSVQNDMIIPHLYTHSATECGIKKIHMPLDKLKSSDISNFDVVGCSVHSPEQAKEAKQNGATYVTAGHIFATDCKKGVPPRGLELIKNIIKAVDIPVYAIGGISPENALSAIQAGAEGVCVMSGFMRCDDIKNYIKMFK